MIMIILMLLESKYSEFNTIDGLRVSATCIDEVGAAKDGGFIESMTSDMLSVKDRLLSYTFVV